jgi:hypothetical protein
LDGSDDAANIRNSTPYSKLHAESEPTENCVLERFLTGSHGLDLVVLAHSTVSSAETLAAHIMAMEEALGQIEANLPGGDKKDHTQGEFSVVRPRNG